MLAPFGAVCGAWACLIAVTRPRLLLYALFALMPTQFLFVPVSTFFVSPADVLVSASGVGLAVRLAAFDPASWRAMFQHRFLLGMLGAYLAGFAVLDVYSRTLIRVPMAITVSILASEQFRTRRHLTLAATALVIAGALDAAYGMYFIARGTPLHPSRFQGMSAVNYAAMLITTASVIALAQLIRIRGAVHLLRPAALGGFAVATLSQMGVIAFLGAWFTVLRRVVSRANKRRIVLAAVAVFGIGLATAPIRSRVLDRFARQVEADGVARSSADVRWMVLELGWAGFAESPAFGLGYFQFQPYSNSNPEIRRSTYGVGYPTHNSYIEVLVEGGVFAFGFFLLHWWQYLRQMPAAVRTAATRGDAALAGAIVGLPVMAVCAALANLLMVYSFWAVCGLALAGLNLVRRERSQPSPVGAPPVAA
jgi:hypothetical protein